MTQFPNPRLFAGASERRRGCFFADDFVSDERVTLNNGTLNGIVQTYRGATCSNGYISYDLKADSFSTFSVVVKFRISTIPLVPVVLLATADLYTIPGSGNVGVSVWLEPVAPMVQSIRANISDSVMSGEEDSIGSEFNYADGEWHTVTYSVRVGTDHKLYVDDRPVVSAASVYATNPISFTKTLDIGKGAVTGYAPEIQYARLFSVALTEDEHDLYSAETVENLDLVTYAKYRCDSFCDDSVGHKIWDSTVNVRHLVKGVDAATRPELNTDKYFFDYVDDYVVSAFSLPDDYTISAIVSDPERVRPYAVQENLLTFWTKLITEGAFWGYLHNLWIFNTELSPLQLAEAELRQLRYHSYGYASGQYAQLIAENVCSVAVFPGFEFGYVNWAQNQISPQGLGDLIKYPDGGGIQMNSHNACLYFPDSADFRSDEISIVLYGNFDAVIPTDRTLADKGTNYKFGHTATQLTFNGSTINQVISGNHQLAVVAKNGFKPRFFVDGEFIGLGSTTVVMDDTDTTELTLLNNNERNAATLYKCQQFGIYNCCLIDQEINALYHSAQLIEVNTVETGSRIQGSQTFTAAAVDYDVDPGGAFQLIDIVVNFNTAPTTSQNITIKSIRSGAVTVNEAVFDPSTSTLTSHVFRFDKRFEKDATIGVDYTNTDGRTITVICTYQLDESVV